jgi:hypothetical protein
MDLLCEDSDDADVASPRCVRPRRESDLDVSMRQDRQDRQDRGVTELDDFDDASFGNGNESAPTSVVRRRRVDAAFDEGTPVSSMRTTHSRRIFAETPVIRAQQTQEFSSDRRHQSLYTASFVDSAEKPANSVLFAGRLKAFSASPMDGAFVPSPVGRVLTLSEMSPVGISTSSTDSFLAHSAQKGSDSGAIHTGRGRACSRIAAAAYQDSVALRSSPKANTRTETCITSPITSSCISEFALGSTSKPDIGLKSRLLVAANDANDDCMQQENRFITMEEEPQHFATCQNGADATAEVTLAASTVDINRSYASHWQNQNSMGHPFEGSGISHVGAADSFISQYSQRITTGNLHMQPHISHSGEEQTKNREVMGSYSQSILFPTSSSAFAPCEPQTHCAKMLASAVPSNATGHMDVSFVSMEFD